MARIRNLLVDRVEILDPNDPQTWSDEELEREYAANPAALDAIPRSRTIRVEPQAEPNGKKKAPKSR